MLKARCMRLLLLCVCGLLCLVFCTPGWGESRIVRLAAAANVQFVLEEWRNDFEKETGIEMKVSFGSSGQLAAQIASGAPFDVFLSADMEYPQKLHEDGLAAAEPKVYAYGSLVVWTSKAINVDSGIFALTDPSIKRIAVANPETAPYGREAVRVMKFYGLYEALESKLVYGESIAQTNNFIVSQAADAGITSKSSVIAAKGSGSFAEIPSIAHQPLAQGAVVLKYGMTTNTEASNRFFEYLFSDRARQILARYGYLVPDE